MEIFISLDSILKGLCTLAKYHILFVLLSFVFLRGMQLGHKDH